MMKVHPGGVEYLSGNFPAAADNYNYNYNSRCLDQEKEAYTVWMKSLVFNGNGFTVYDSHGGLVYRIDNYSSKCSTQVFLMDRNGDVLCTLLRKKFSILEHWSGYKGEGVKYRKPWFQVKKITSVFNKRSRLSCQVMVRGDESQETSYIRIQGSVEKSEYQIINNNGSILAEVKRKQVSKGVMLGNDVLSLEVEAHMDQSFIMALVVVQGLISHKI